jgi:O-antigen ligase
MLPAIWHRYFFLFGLFSLAAGMLFGTVPTSVPQFILAGNWVLEGNFLIKWQRLKKNNLFWILIFFFIIHLAGMLYTTDLQRGIDDIRNKLPLLLLPLFLFSAEPINRIEIKYLFRLFFLSVVVSSVSCYLVYLGVTGKQIVELRKASIFMSHIRFSLFIAFAIIGMLYDCLRENHIKIKMIILIGIIWLLFFLFKFQMATGLICLVVSGVILFLNYISKKFSKRIVYISIAVIIALVFPFIRKAYVGLSMYDYNPALTSNKLVENNVSGKLYLQDTLFGLAENGTLITINIIDSELRNEWNKKSKIQFDSLDYKNNNLRFTILRYLSSYGYTKDSVGLSLLSVNDIKNIENGVTNYKYSETGIYSRWRELVWEFVKFKRSENPSGHTMTMRLEFWKTALYIIQKNPLFGVGTGDAQLAFNQAYIDTYSNLDLEWRLRSHNQYFAVGVTFGLIGLLYFIFYLFYPVFKFKKKLNKLYWPFLSIALLSFFTEDTLETQTGVTFFIFFQSLFLWLASSSQKQIDRAVN